MRYVAFGLILKHSKRNAERYCVAFATNAKVKSEESLPTFARLLSSSVNQTVCTLFFTFKSSKLLQNLIQFIFVLSCFCDAL